MPLANDTLFDWYLVGYADGLIKAHSPASAGAADTASRVAYVLGMRAATQQNGDLTTKAEVDRRVAELMR